MTYISDVRTRLHLHNVIKHFVRHVSVTVTVPIQQRRSYVLSCLVSGKGVRE